MSTNKALYCSACGKWQTEVENLISMPGPMFICDGCVGLLHEIEEKRKTGDPVQDQESRAEAGGSSSSAP